MVMVRVMVELEQGLGTRLVGLDLGLKLELV